MSYDEIRFVAELFKDLYYGIKEKNNIDKLSLIERYFYSQNELHKKMSSKRSRINVLKSFYYDKYIIRKENIADKYFKRLHESCLERGYGPFIVINDNLKNIEISRIIEEQKNSLDKWIEYLITNEAYPFWKKYWAFRGMLQIGNYNIKKGTYYRRTKKTVSPFIEVNPEAIAIAMDLIQKKINKETIDDVELNVLAKNGSFAKIYIKLLKRYHKKSLNYSSEGSWIKYDRGSDHTKMVKSLTGYNTGWCIAGDSVARDYLSQGDFYIYYTKNKKGEYKVPRIAIRMDEDEIAEIRGIAKDQNLEPEMDDALSEKLKFFPDKAEKYYEKVADMRKLTIIYKKNKNNEELTVDELIFLYEIDSPIKGFGWNDDSRIYEIKTSRNKINDFNKIFSIRKEFNDLNFCGLTSAEGLDFSGIKVNGSMYLYSLTTAKGLDLSEVSIAGILNLYSLTDAKGLKLSKLIGDSLYLSSLRSAEDLELSGITIGGNLDLYSLTTAEYLDLSGVTIGGNLYLNSLVSTENLDLSNTIVKGTIYINGNVYIPPCNMCSEVKKLKYI